MSAPVCRICGHAHWNPVEHVWAKTATKASPAKPSAKTVAKAPAKPKRGRPISDAPKSPRADYQRELMRKRREVLTANRSK